MSCEALAVSEGCLHQLWRRTHSSSDKGKNANLRTLAAVLPDGVTLVSWVVVVHVTTVKESKWRPYFITYSEI